jgi:chromosome segregation ATPase
MKMKKLFILAGVILVCVNLAGLIYLYRRQEAAELKIAGSVFKELDEKQQIEESLKQNLESKKRDREFIVQRDIERQFENLVQQLERYKAQLDAAERKNAEYAKSKEISEQQTRSDVQKLDVELRQRLEEDRLRSQEAYAGLIASLARLEDKLKAVQESLKAELHSQDSQLAKHNSRLREYRQKLDQALSEIAALKSKVDDVARCAYKAQ